mgnify:CR=1 FL=1
MLLLIKYTLLYGIVLMLVALGGMFSEHSGIINIALEGIMVIGGVAGVLTLTMLPASMPAFATVIIAVLVAAIQWTLKKKRFRNIPIIYFCREKDWRSCHLL